MLCSYDAGEVEEKFGGFHRPEVWLNVAISDLMMPNCSASPECVSVCRRDLESPHAETSSTKGAGEQWKEYARLEGVCRAFALFTMPVIIVRNVNKYAHCITPPG